VFVHVEDLYIVHASYYYIAKQHTMFMPFIITNIAI